jgi:hypothetical protein
MKKLLPLFLLAFSLATPALAAGPTAAPVQFPGSAFPDQRFPDQRFPAQNQIHDMESQQITQETLIIMRDMVTVMRQAKDLDPGDSETLENLSSRLDFLLTRLQDLSMRGRM